jgi:hypothetical protein
LCQGRPYEEQANATQSAAMPPPGPPQLTLLAPVADPRVPWSLDQLEGARLGVTMASSTLGDLALSLSELLSLPVVVERSLVGVRLSMRLPDASLGGLIQVLHEEYGVVSTIRREVLNLESERSARWRDGLPGVDRPPQREIYEARLESRLLTPPRDVLPAQLAAALCHHVASPRGRASVVGQQVLLTDVPVALERADLLVTALSSRELPEVYRPREW